MPASARTTPLAVAGNGIAAEAIALALAAAGKEVTLVGDGGGPSSGGVQLAPNAWTALDRLGAGQEALKKACKLSSLRMMELSSGVCLTDIPLNRTARRSPYASIARSDLVELLARAADRTGRVTRLKTRLAGIERQAGRVGMALGNGRTLSAGWLVGCDGSTGVCRAFVEAEAGRKPLHARSVFRATIPKPPAEAVPHGGMATTVWLGRGGHCVHYPLADGSVNMVAVVGASAGSREAALRMIGRQPLLARFADAVDAAPELQLMGHGRLDAWQRGRVILAGDAAHPMPPHLAQGAGQSLVDASSLLEALGQHGGEDLQPLFTSWSAGRAAAIRGVSRDADRAGMVFSLDGPAAAVRNIGLSTVGGPVLGRLLDRIWNA